LIIVTLAIRQSSIHFFKFEKRYLGVVLISLTFKFRPPPHHPTNPHQLIAMSDEEEAPSSSSSSHEEEEEEEYAEVGSSGVTPEPTPVSSSREESKAIEASKTQQKSRLKQIREDQNAQLTKEKKTSSEAR
jgi:hypothetical protein